MNTNGNNSSIKEYTFLSLLKDYKIEIPKIQRDYAQGRKTEERIAKKFIKDIKEHLENDKKLNLDFIYGSVNNNTFIPLDGQQRLTTLFLLHWYIALKENKLNDIRDTLIKFTYETRLSSKDFCEALIKEIDNGSIEEKVSEIITNKNWFFLSWKLDPTISAMLNMLDIIHEEFKDIKDELFDRLERITFYFLSLDDFNLTDELYIKMNARGKQLTDFENFKAILSKNENLEENDKSKMDNQWLDIFWNLEKDNLKKGNLNDNESAENKKIIKSIDEKFFNFFNVFTFNFYKQEQNKIKIDKEEESNLFDLYKKISENKEISKKYVEHLRKILNALTKYENIKEIITFNYADSDDENNTNKKSFNIFEDILSSQSTYVEKLRFYSLCQFFINLGENPNQALEDENNRNALKKWIRVTKNLINNTQFKKDKYVKLIKSIEELSKNTKDKDLYNFIKNLDNKDSVFSERQIKEEKLKANLILQDNDNENKWEDLFIEIENHPYFSGQIGFIIKYSEKDGKVNKECFKKYSKILSELFGSIKEENDFLFQRALLTKGNGDYLPMYNNNYNYTFCNFKETLDEKEKNWRKVFNDNDKANILKELLDDIIKRIEESQEEINHDNVLKTLNNIVEEYKKNSEISKTHWIKLIIENPDAIKYCDERCIHWKEDENGYYSVLLLKKTNLRSTNTNLHTWVLYRKAFESESEKEKFKPFSERRLLHDTGDTYEKFIELSGFNYNNKYNFNLEISHEYSSENCTAFLLKFNKQDNNDFPKEIKRILEELEELKFKNVNQQNENTIQYEILLGKDDEIEQVAKVVQNICKKLQELSCQSNKRTR